MEQINIRMYGGIDVKIVTLCGSLKFQKEMMTVAKKLGKEIIYYTNLIENK